MENLPGIKQFLLDIGFSFNEIEIYFTLLKSDALTTAEISRKSDVPRTSVIRNLEKLAKKGLVSKTRKNSDKLFLAESPKKLELLLSEKAMDYKTRLERIRANKEILDGLMKDIATLQKDQSKKISFRYFEGIKGVKNTYKLIVESGAKQIFTFLNADKYFNLFPETHDLFKQFLIDNPDSWIYEILVGDVLSKALKGAISDIGEHCICKYGASNIEFKDFDFLIYEDKVVMIQISEDQPVAILIESEAISSGLKGMHQILWNFLPNTQPDKA